MEISFKSKNTIHRIDNDKISSLVEYRDINVDKDSENNIIIDEHSEYFSYIVTILDNEITTMKDLLLSYLTLIDKSKICDAQSLMKQNLSYLNDFIRHNNVYIAGSHSLSCI